MTEGTKKASLRVGCDIGGTFTDFVLSDSASNTVTIHKRLTTPDRPERAVLEGLSALTQELGAAGIDTMVHATTLVVNAVIEGKGSPTGLITTRGFRDILELRRHMRTHVFDIYGDPAVPLVPRWLRHEVDERIFADGSIVTPLEEQQVVAAACELLAQGVETIAVVFLHSYVNPEHEERARQLILSVAPNLEVSISSEVMPTIGEYNRTSTTVINAYAKPLVRRYLGRLRKDSAAYGVTSLYVMSSDGGLAAVETSIDFPCRMIESGPVAGAIAAQSVATAAGLKNVLAFDMGGTTAKACLLRDGVVPITSDLEVARTQRFRKGSGYPVSVPSVDLIEIGAGGGSIASINALGLIQVGPESAAASPGPACYGLGGDAPTVTDANLVLGYLSAKNFLGGRMELDEAAARNAIRTRVADPLSISVEDAAWRIHDVANEMMAHAVRRHLVEKGGGDEAVTIIAFGGAGPVHAYNLAGKLGIEDVLIPLRAGVASAVGLLAAPVAFHLVHAMRVHLAEVEPDQVRAEFGRLETIATTYVARAASSGPVTCLYSVDVRFCGQGYELRIDIDQSHLASISGPEIERLFHAAYEKRFGYFYDDMPSEIVNLHLEAAAGSPDQAALMPPTAITSSGVAPTVRPVWNPEQSFFVQQEVHSRVALGVEQQVNGPAAIEEDESTTVLGFGGSAVVDRNGSLRLKVKGTRP